MDIGALHDRARGGDSKAEDALFRTLTVRFRLFAKRRIWDGPDAEEVVQEALLAVADKYKAMEFEQSFAAWAHGVLNKEILGYYRRKGLREARFGQPPGDDCQTLSPAPDTTLKRKLLDCLEKIGRLNRRYARILNLHYQGYTTTEVCLKLEMTSNHTYVALSRARSMLAVCLETGDVR